MLIKNDCEGLTNIYKKKKNTNTKNISKNSPKTVPSMPFAIHVVLLQNNDTCYGVGA